MRFVFICFYLLLCCAFTGFAKQKAPSITARMINLPGSFNRDLLQVARDEEGFMWLGTNEGIWRFDGSDLKLFDNKKLKLSQNLTVFSLYCYDRFIVLSLNNGELHIYNKITDECDVYQLSTLITSFNNDTHGDLLFFTNDGQAWRFTKQGRLEKAFDLERFQGWEQGMKIDNSIIDNDGHVYLFLWDRIGEVSKNSIAWSPLITAGNSKTHVQLGVVIGTAVTSKFIAAQYFSGEVALYDKKTLQPVYFCKAQLFATCLAVDDQIVLIPHDDHEPVDMPNQLFFHVQKGVFTESSKVFRVVPGKENQFLLGSTTGIMELTVHRQSENNYYDQQKVVAFFKNKSIRSIYRLNNKLYVGSYSGFYVCTNDSIKKVNSGVAYTMEAESAGNLLLAIEGGPGFALFNTRTEAFDVFPKLVPGIDIYTTVLFKDNKTWITGDYVALRRLSEENGNWHLQTLVADSSRGTFRQVRRIKGSIYVAGEYGLFRLTDSNSLQKIYPESGTLRVYAMQEVADGIWLGTHGNGLVKINRQGKVVQQLGFNEGLASSFVYSLVLMDNLLVAGTGGGVSIFDISGNALPIPVKEDEKNNGLSSEECNHSAFYYDAAAGKVILGGVKGLIFIDRRDYAAQQTAANDRLLLSYFKSGAHETQSSAANLFAYGAEKLIIHPDDLNIVLKFAAPGNPDQEEGLFRLRGLDDNWQRVKIGQEVNLYSLPPGKYILEARLPFMLDQKGWFTKTLIIEPAFYQTWFFKVLLILLCAGIVYLLWRSKLKKIERDNQLRSSIAGDLHDDIGSTLNSVSVYAVLAAQQMQSDPSKAKVLLDRMGIASREMIDRMSDIVWAINPKNDDFEIVLQRMQFFAAELLSGKNIHLDFDIDEQARKLKFAMEERKNIYLVYKEAVNNAFKYSGADTVSVSVIKEEKQLVLTIADNGTGFETGKINGNGNGLSNMKKRAREMGGKISIESSSGRGTKIMLHARFRRALV